MNSINSACLLLSIASICLLASPARAIEQKKQEARPDAPKQHSSHHHNTSVSLIESGLKHYNAGEYSKAAHLFNQLNKTLPNSKVAFKAKTLLAEADCLYQSGDYVPALNLLKGVLSGKVLDFNSLREGSRATLLAELNCAAGECLYELEKHNEASRYFNTAIEIWKDGGVGEDVLLRSLEGLGASFIKMDDYEKALPLYQEVAYLDRARYGIESIPYAWSLRILNDIYWKLKSPKLARQCFERSVWNFRNANYQRLVPVWVERMKAAKTQFASSPSELEKLIADRIFGTLGNISDINFLNPGLYTGITDYSVHTENAASESEGSTDDGLANQLPWSRKRVAVLEPASTMWADPREEIKGIVVCVPGFGLHRRSFADLGESLASKGFVVASYDVRGFGAYTALKARDRIDLEKSLEDLDDSIIQLRKDFKGVPVFILGESMGGSIALQFCAHHPELVEGLIAAVPSEQRYRQWLTASKVLVGLITGSRKPIDVGPVVVSRATQKKDLRETWTSDPSSRFTATARELYGFKRFVSRNHSLARQVKNTPVLMFQGVHDLLIRPEGTISLFKAVACEDKDLMLIGKSEHLVFEEGQFDKNLLVSICDWMRNHSDTANEIKRETETKKQ
ncbi:MAG: alpha/beta fold hydrolase [Candidatus Obscuribacterales bacterium]|nr:alpha/beta fold hydrolase [Candidatus Obscuribacterales bacterium]